MNPAQFKSRTKRFALRVLKLCDALPHSRSGDALARQLIRSGTSVGANYRAACRALSKRDMLAKLGDVEEEADESLFWMELITDHGLMPPPRMESIMREGNEILAMVVASRRTLREGLARVAKRGTRIDNRQSKIENRK